MGFVLLIILLHVQCTNTTHPLRSQLNILTLKDYHVAKFAILQCTLGSYADTTSHTQSKLGF